MIAPEPQRISVAALAFSFPNGGRQESVTPANGPAFPDTALAYKARTQAPKTQVLIARRSRAPCPDQGIIEDVQEISVIMEVQMFIL